MGVHCVRVLEVFESSVLIERVLLIYYLLETICKVPELQLEILLALFWIVDIESLRVLRGYSQVRHLWKRVSGVSLQADLQHQRKFCEDVITFQVGKLAAHPGIQFGNITVVQMQILPRRRLIRSFSEAFKFLKLRDLTVYCADTPTFMKDALAIWAPSLQSLQILRIRFDRDMDLVSFFLFCPLFVRYLMLLLYTSMSLSIHGAGTPGQMAYLSFQNFVLSGWKLR